MKSVAAKWRGELAATIRKQHSTGFPPAEDGDPLESGPGAISRWHGTIEGIIKFMRVLYEGATLIVPLVRERKRLASLSPLRLCGELQSRPDALRAEHVQIFMTLRIKFQILIYNDKF